MKSLLENLFEYSKKYPDKQAVIFEKNSITYGDLWLYSSRLCSCFLQYGIGAGDRIAVKSVYSKWFVISCYAAWLCHAVFVPIDIASDIDTETKVCKQIQAKCLISDNDNKEVEVSLRLDCLENCISSCPLCSVSFPEENSFANIMFTSGTTGMPKGAIWSHKSITANCLNRQKMFNLNSSSVDLSFVPLNHAAPLWKLYAVNFFGGTCIFVDGLTKLPMIHEMMKKYSVSSLYTPPSGITVIEKLAPDFFKDFIDRLKFISIGSASLNKQQMDFILNALPNTEIIFSYASSETGCNTKICLNREEKNPNCAGKVSEGVRVIILDEYLHPVEKHCTGTVAVKSDMNFSGYWNNKEATEQSFSDSYVITSDFGYFDDEGYLYITGRKDDTINIGGLKVNPAEIEQAVAQIAGVEECICFGVPDKITGTAACLNIVKEEQSELSVQTIRQILTKVLDTYKIPKYIVFTTSICRTANGKPSRILQAEQWKLRKRATVEAALP